MTKTEYRDGLCRAYIKLEQMVDDASDQTIGRMLAGRQNAAQLSCYELVPLARQMAAVYRAYTETFSIQQPDFDEETSGGG